MYTVLLKHIHGNHLKIIASLLRVTQIWHTPMASYACAFKEAKKQQFDVPLRSINK